MESSPKASALLACSHDEWQGRTNLAAMYRLFSRFGWTDLTYTHLSARVPGEPEHYLINPYGLLFDEITASSLIKVDFKGRVLNGQHPYNTAGHKIHTAVLQARPEINYVLHSHTRAGMAVSAMQCGLLPLSEHANAVLGSLAYHKYDVVEVDSEECEYLARDLGDKFVMVLHNHGLLACGRTASEAFLYHYFLEMACAVQVEVLSSGQQFIKPSDEVIAKLSAWGAPRLEPWGSTQWNALLRLLERKDPSFKE